LSFGAACSRMEAHDSIAAVVGTAKKLRQFRLRYFPGNLLNLGRRLVQSLFVFFIFSDFQKKARLFKTTLVLLPGLNDFFKRGLFPENPLGFFAVVPEIRTRRQLVKFFDPLLL
jgi:hypothetical protein